MSATHSFAAAETMAASPSQAALDEAFMRTALALAAQAEALGEVPVGAVVVKDGRIIGQGHNRPIGDHDPSAHAEIQALRAASAAESNYRLAGCTLYVTLEPCVMCAGAILQSRIKRLVFGAFDQKAGAVGSSLDVIRDARALSKVEVVSGVLEKECAKLLTDFFATKR
jgi:tRNA(adenine34) deaminase